MAFTQSDLDALDEAIASGELSVDIDGKKVVYRSIAQLVKAKQHIEQAINATTGKRPPRGVRVNVSKGI